MNRLLLFPSLLLLAAASQQAQAFVAPMPLSFVKQSTRLFDSEDMPEPESALMEQVQRSTMLGIDQDFVPFPHTEYTAPEVVELCMKSMQQNDSPYGNAGLEVCFNFSSDRCRAAQGGSLEAFIQFAHNPVFSTMMNAMHWNVVNTGPVIPGTKTRGAMQTVLIHLAPSNGGSNRRFLWTLQQERRPPRQGCWLVYECIDTENAYSLTL